MIRYERNLHLARKAIEAGPVDELDLFDSFGVGGNFARSMLIQTINTGRMSTARGAASNITTWYLQPTAGGTHPPVKGFVDNEALGFNAFTFASVVAPNGYIIHGSTYFTTPIYPTVLEATGSGTFGTGGYAGSLTYKPTFTSKGAHGLLDADKLWVRPIVPWHNYPNAVRLLDVEWYDEILEIDPANHALGLYSGGVRGPSGPLRAGRLCALSSDLLLSRTLGSGKTRSHQLAFGDKTAPATIPGGGGRFALSAVWGIASGGTPTNPTKVEGSAKFEVGDISWDTTGYSEGASPAPGAAKTVTAQAVRDLVDQFPFDPSHRILINLYVAVDELHGTKATYEAYYANLIAQFRAAFAEHGLEHEILFRFIFPHYHRGTGGVIIGGHGTDGAAVAAIRNTMIAAADEIALADPTRVMWYSEMDFMATAAGAPVLFDGSSAAQDHLADLGWDAKEIPGSTYGGGSGVIDFAGTTDGHAIDGNFLDLDRFHHRDFSDVEHQFGALASAVALDEAERSATREGAGWSGAGRRRRLIGAGMGDLVGGA